MKKLTGLDDKLPTMDESPSTLATYREILRMVGNTKADTADNARRTVRLLNKIRDKNSAELILENEDLSFLQKRFEENTMNLTAWAQGQILEFIDNADKVETSKG